MTNLNWKDWNWSFMGGQSKEEEIKKLVDRVSELEEQLKAEREGNMLLSAEKLSFLGEPAILRGHYMMSRYNNGWGDWHLIKLKEVTP